AALPCVRPRDAGPPITARAGLRSWTPVRPPGARSDCRAGASLPLPSGRAPASTTGGDRPPPLPAPPDRIAGALEHHRQPADGLRHLGILDPASATRSSR